MSKIGKFAETMSQGAEKELRPWTNDGFNDITWTELHSGHGTASFGSGYFRKRYPSLREPNTYWLE